MYLTTGYQVILNIFYRNILEVGLWFLRYFQQYFCYIVAVSFIGGRKPEYPEKNTDFSGDRHWLLS
jgi:hypothetical protein